MLRIRLRTILWLPVILISAVIIYIRLYVSLDQDASIKNNFNRNIEKYKTFFTPHTSDLRNAADQEDEIIIAVVVCGQRSDETLVMIKSAIVFQSSLKLRFIVLCDHDLQDNFHKNLSRMKSQTNNSFTYQLLNLSFPQNRKNEWRNLFQPCAAQRLFLPTVLPNVSKVLYVDTDVLFLNDLSDIWGHFRLMNSSQMSALTPEHEELNTGWYNRFARHPYYGKLGVNSGVMLMNLTKMREFKWVDYLLPILSKFKSNLTWGDQDIINIIFYYHPDKLYIYSCRYNYRSDHCMYKSNCKDAEIHGVSVIHGSRRAFFSDKQSSFKAIFQAFSQYELGSNRRQYLLEPLKFGLQKTTNTSCGSVMNIFLKNMISLFEDKKN